MPGFCCRLLKKFLPKLVGRSITSMSFFVNCRLVFFYSFLYLFSFIIVISVPYLLHVLLPFIDIL